MSTTPIGVAVVEHRGHFLVGVRGRGTSLPGLTEFPGGKCLGGESPRDCAVRECLEETGLTVELVELLLNRQFRYEHGEVDLHFWLCRPVENVSMNGDHHGFRWVSTAELPSLDFPPANAPVIALLTGR